MKVLLKSPSLLPLWIWLLLSQAVLAVPTFQVYIQGATAGNLGPDEQSWLTTDSTFNLIAIGSYGPNTNTLTEVTLALSVPQGETGTILITGGDIGAALLTVKEQVPDTLYYNPNANANISLLTDATGNTGYTDKRFLPEGDGTNFNNHYPFQEGVSYFLIYGIGDFDPCSPVHNYNADPPGTITEVSNSRGEEKLFGVSITGFSRVHFDLYGYEQDLNGNAKLKVTWGINPGSHDSTYTIPAPGAILLASIGAGIVGWLHRRRIL